MTKTGPRTYTKTRRAELEHQTRAQITQAAMELHGSVGPAKTTISAIAQQAGVQRATVYRHFPDQESIFAACSAHWTAQNPRPDPTRWAAVDEPQARLVRGLGELYAWYERNQQMIELLARDAPMMPSMHAQYRAFASYREAVTDALCRGRSERGAQRRRVRAAIAHAVTFGTWRSLTQHGLTNSEAIELMTRLAPA